MLVIKIKIYNFTNVTGKMKRDFKDTALDSFLEVRPPSSLSLIRVMVRLHAYSSRYHVRASSFAVSMTAQLVEFLTPQNDSYFDAFLLL